MENKMDLRKICESLKTYLEKEYDFIKFEYGIVDDKLKAAANYEPGSCGDVRLIIAVYPNGAVSYRAVFDDIDMTPDTLYHVNNVITGSPFSKRLSGTTGSWNYVILFMAITKKVSFKRPESSSHRYITLKTARLFLNLRNF